MTGVGEERIKITVDVEVGDGVSVLRVGVTDGVSVDEGMTAAVWVAAALTVCAIKVPITPGSIVGTTGVPRAGTQAMMITRAVTHINNFLLRVMAMVSLPDPNKVRR
jgi:hypothetical protein